MSGMIEGNPSELMICGWLVKARSTYRTIDHWPCAPFLLELYLLYGRRTHLTAADRNSRLDTLGTRPAMVEHLFQWLDVVPVSDLLKLPQTSTLPVNLMNTIDHRRTNVHRPANASLRDPRWALSSARSPCAARLSTPV